MIKGLSEFLKNQKDKIVKKIRYNEVKEKRGYSEYTWWMETVSYEEFEAVDFDELMKQIKRFEDSFKEKSRD